ncbi:MAG: rhodanese-like domain-containing protein [Thermodesulfobacteriota bacterium]|jgi:rhodanese-related sulfurtransferase|nr:MAG: rhodanese-like domain-containing protein [Thermodesulfobacteriota bacterium]
MIKEDLSEAAIIFFITVSLALVVNFFRSDSLPLVQTRAKSVSFPTKNNQESTISFQDLKENFNKPDIILIDVRSPQEFKRGHIPWSINIPYHEFSEKLPGFMQQISFSQEVIVYCERIECSDAKYMAFLLKAKGYKNVKVFKEGWEEWTKNNMPKEKEGGG